MNELERGTIGYFSNLANKYGYLTHKKINGVYETSTYKNHNKLTFNVRSVNLDKVNKFADVFGIAFIEIKRLYLKFISIERLVMYSYDNVLGKKVYLHEGNWKIVDKHLTKKKKELMKEVV